MRTEAEIKADYKETHDLLSDLYYAGLSGLTKEEFERNRRIPGTIARPAWMEGRVLYERL